MKAIALTSALLVFALTANIGIAGAFAQQKKKRVPSNSSTSVSNKSRTQRATPKPSPGATPSPVVQPTTGMTSVPDNASSTKPATSSEAEPVNNEHPGESETPSRPVETAKGSSSNDPTSLRGQIEAAPNGPERIRLQLRLAEQLIASGQRAEAKTELHSIVQSDAFDPQGFYNAGNALARVGDYDEAINAYRKAIEQRKGRYSRALNNLGVLLLRMGRWDEAQESFLSALKLESFHYAEASYNLGRLYASRGQKELAVREWRRALSVDPEHRAAAQALAGGDSGIIVKTEPPVSSAPKTVKSYPEHLPAEPATPLVRSIRIARSAKPSTIPSTTLALDAASYDFLQRARDLSERGKLEEAVENYERVISRSHGYFAPANFELSYVLIRLKRNDEALANLLKLIDRDEARYPISHYYLARLFELKGDLASAEAAFSKAAMVYRTENNSFLLDLMRVRERQGNFKGALSALEEYISAMEKQGMKPSWAEETLSVLRQKVTSEPK